MNDLHLYNNTFGNAFCLVLYFILAGSRIAGGIYMDYLEREVITGK
jgi:hypothetical protein